MNKLTILTTLIFTLFIVGCGGEEKPDLSTLEGKKEWLKMQKVEFNKLKKEIAELEQKIEKEDPQAKKKPKVLKITVDTSRVENYQEFIEVQGSIATKGTFVASSELGGRVLSLNVSEGDYVRKGDLIAKLDDSQITSGIAEIETGLALARDVYERRARLWAQGIGAELEYLQAKNNVEGLEKKLASVQVNLGKTNVYSPATGVVEMVNIKQGELAGPGMPVVTMFDLSRVQIVANIAENYLKSVKKGQRIAVEIPAIEYETTARVSKIGAMMNPMNRTFSIEADVSNKGGKLKPNMTTMLKLKEYEKENAVTIPTNLIKQDTKGDYVFIVKKDRDNTIARKVRIEIGRSSNGQTIVESGLEGKEIIIAEGRSAVKDGDLVKVQ